MRRRLSVNAVIVAVSAAVALVLTITRPTPTGLISLGLGGPAVRAAPGAPAASVVTHNLTALRIFNRTLVRVRDAYVDPVRIDPKKMLYAALDSVQFDVPEVLVEPRTDQNQVVVQVNNKRRVFSTKDVDSPWRLSGRLKEIFRFVEANMNPGADLAKVEYAAVNGMLRTLDPHSVLLDPETAREMNVSTSGFFGGLGIVIRMYKRKLTIVRPIKGTPAHAAGVKRGDIIAKINSEVTENLTLQEAVNRMRGKTGTPVTLWVSRKGTQQLLKFPITRARIRVESVEKKLLPNGIGYIRIKQFSGRTAKETKNAMSSLRAQGAKAWVLDLRWNPGGLLEQAIKVADLFVDKGTLVTTVGGNEREPRRAHRSGTDTTAPIAVLVNGSSASASEIVAGALKNRDRAVIIGTTTFGKGSVQILYDNKDGSKLKLTIAQYLTPGDKSIQSVGIVPDVRIDKMVIPKPNKVGNTRIRLLPPTNSYREADLSAHLTSRYAKGGDRPTFRLPFVKPLKKKANNLDEDGDPFGDDEPMDDEFVEDYAIKLARDFVGAAGNVNRRTSLKAAKRFIAQRRAETDKILAARLKALGITWDTPTNRTGPRPSLTATMTLDPSGTVRAGDLVKITGTVTNTGTVPAHQVHARIKSDDRTFNDAEFLFGRVDPGQSRTFTARIRVRPDSVDRLDVLTFEFREARHAKLSVPPVKFQINAAARPTFAYSHQLIDKGNGDGLVQLGERHTLRVTIKNIGQGVSKETTALLRNSSGHGLFVKKGRFPLKELKPGESKTVEFVFDVTKKFRSKSVIVEMSVYDAALHTSVSEKLTYRVQSPTAGPAPATGFVQITSNGVNVYEGAATTSGRIARARRGTSFAVTGRHGRWTRVKLGDGRPGFIATDKLRRTRRRVGKSTVKPIWQVTPPRLSLQIPSYETTASAYQLRGRATDESRVEDVYIFVSNRTAKIENRKVFYRSNRGAASANVMDFQAKIPLQPGSNRVTIVVRENDAVQSTHTMYLYRTKTH